MTGTLPGYVTSEYIVTTGCLSKSGTLRQITKQFYAVGTVSLHTNLRITLGMGFHRSNFVALCTYGLVSI